MDFSLRQDRNLDHVSGDLAQEDAMCSRGLTKILERFAIDVLVGDENVHRLDRDIKELAIVDLLGPLVDEIDQQFAARSNGDHVAGP